MKTKVIEIQGQECVLVTELFHFDLGQIMDSGQCFRICGVAPDRCGVKRAFSVCWGEWHVRVDEMIPNGIFVFHCTVDDFQSRWYYYFSLHLNYFDMVKEQLEQTPDAFLEAALNYGGGIRILNQGLWETLICFMISQNNNIKRIAKSVDLLCKTYGSLKYDRGFPYYSFPSWTALMSVPFDGFGLGYRAAYFEELLDVHKMRQFEKWYWEIKEADYTKAKELLMQAKGIGDKVADCVCLYGLGHLGSYPIDTWMQKIVDRYYDGRFNVEPYKVCAGYVQQLQFYYYRSNYKELAK